MSSQGSPTPSMDSDSSASAAELDALAFEKSPEEIVDVLSFKRTATPAGLDMILSKKPVPGEDCDKWKAVTYRGTMTRPLAYFGSFELKSERKELPWISDNTSGEVHPDMHTISMLFNEDLALPEAAKNFVEQSSVLKEEARWERVKAAFYSFYPEDLKKTVFEVLSEMSPRDASRIIAKKTSRFENEIILISKPKNIESWDDSDSESWDDSDSESESDSPVDAESCCEADAEELNKLLPNITQGYKEKIALALQALRSAKYKLSTHNCFVLRKINHTVKQVEENSASWTQGLKEYQEATRKCVEARLLFHHLDNSVARYEPRTGWIHVKTQLLRRRSEENKTLQKELFQFKMYPEYKIKGSVDAQNAAIDKQMALFEKGLYGLSTGHFNTLDFDHNILSYHEYEVRVPYERIAPAMCGTVVRSLLPEDGWNFFNVVSEPELSPYEKSHHVLKVYIDLHKGKVPYSSNATFNATLEYKDRYGCCVNCFSKNHRRVKCGEPVYGFASPINAKDEK